jgi:hypothetical protein
MARTKKTQTAQAVEAVVGAQSQDPMAAVGVFNAQAIEEAAHDFATSEVLADGSVKAVASILGTDPAYTLWESVRVAFCDKYAAARSVDAETARRAWSRFVARMGGVGVTKPKAPSAGAARKTAERSKAQKRVESIVDQYKTVEAIKAASAALPIESTPVAEVKAHSDALLAVLKRTKEASEKVGKEKLEKAKKSLADTMKEMTPDMLAMLAHAATLIRAGKKVTFK